MNRLRRFIFNGIIMAVVSVFMRSVAVAFNVYISNKIGAVAMGLFSLISTVYGFGITFATSGINLATTRVVAQAIGDTSGKDGIKTAKNTGNVRCIMTRCIVYSLFFSVIATVVLWCFADFLGTSVLRDIRTVRSLRILSLTFIPISLSSVFGGYFSAIRQVSKNALTAVVGQGVKIYASIALLSAVFASDVESACVAVVLGGAIAELLSFLLALILYLCDRPKKKSSIPDLTKKKATRDVLGNSLPLAFSTYMRSALVTIEHILIPRGLEKSGSSKDLSLAAYGTVSGMVFPLVLFPSAVSAAFAGLLIPEVAESSEVGDTRRIHGIINTVMETVLTFSIGCAGVIMSFSLELGRTIYPNADDAGRFILMIAPLIPVMYLDTAIDAMLKGMGEHVYSMCVNIADAFISVILVALLLPRMGIYGYIVTVYFTEILNATLSITRLLSKSNVKTRAVLWVSRALLCVVAATRLVHLIPLSGVWLRIVLAGLAYVLFMTVCGGIKPRVVADRVRYIVRER